MAHSAAVRPYHYGETLICTDCHRMTPRDEDRRRVPRASRADASEMCVRCHDGHRGIPDVILNDVNELRDRSAGFFAAPGTQNPRGHDLALHRTTGPEETCNRCHAGVGESTGLTCVDCHEPHGNGNPRNLRWASDPDGTPPLGLFTANHTFSGALYADSDGNGVHSMHPSYDSERADANTIAGHAGRHATNPEHWNRGRGSGFDGAIARTGCDQCHATEPLPDNDDFLTLRH